MGRYYDGDINGKFWFAVQDSDDAEFFGVEGTQNYLNFYFTQEDLPGINKGIKKCNENLKPYKAKMNSFFKKQSTYNNKQLMKALDLKKERKVKELLEWYARLELGEKIKKCVEKTGQCDFEAEL